MAAILCVMHVMHHVHTLMPPLPIALATRPPIQYPPWGRQVSSRTLEPDLRWAYDLGLDTLLAYLKVTPSCAARWRASDLDRV
jgi:hypothetical protein